MNDERYGLRRGRSRSDAADHFAALPHPSRELERADVEEQGAHAPRHECPPIRELGGDDAETAEDRRGYRDDQPGEVLRRATGPHARRDDHGDAPGRDEVEERQHEQRVDELRRERVRDALRAVPVAREGVRGGEGDGARGQYRYDHADELAEHDVEVADRRREQRHERPVLLLRGERGGDERHTGEGREEDALQRECDDRGYPCLSAREAAVPEHEKDRDDHEDRGPQERRPIEEDLPADLSPRDEPPFHWRGSPGAAGGASSP